MIRSYLKIAWRNFYKRPFYSLINIFGLALGISCTIVLFLFISYHLSFDTYHTNAKRVYRAVTELHLPDGSIEYDQGTPYVLGQILKQGIPAVENQTVLLEKRTFTVAATQPGTTKQNLFNETETVAFTDNNWFKLFTYNWVSGNQNNPLTEPYTAVITADLAKKYFNTTDATGKTIRLDNKYNVSITGVLEDNPKNTDVQSKMFLSLASVKPMYPDMKDFWTDIGFISSKNHVYVLLHDDQSLKAVDQRMPEITKKPLEAYGGAYHFHLQPLTDIHFDNRYSGTIAKPLLLILATIGLALILIACVNFINMATAQSLTRAKEIGTRKVLGSTQKGIFWQFITETAYVTLAAVAIAVLMTALFLPQLNSWLQLPLAINKNLILFLGVLIVLVVFIAGFYPAVILSRFKPVNALKNIISNINPTSKVSRGVLIVAQNVVAQVLIVCTLIITLQVKFLKNANLGFNKDAVIMLPVPNNDAAKLSFLHNELSAARDVKNVSFCYRPPSSTSDKGGTIRFDNKPWEKFAVRSVIGDENYTKTFGLQLLAGRNITATDTNATAYLVNEQLLLKLGIKNPEQIIGHQLTDGDFSDKNGIIVGVVKDFHIHSLHDKIDPAVIASKSALYEYAAVKISGQHQSQTINTIQQKWQATFPQNVFEYHFLDEQLADFYRKDEMINKLIKTSSIIAIVISCLGMLGLISLITVQRTKEIGIRKVLGASVSNIVGLLTGSFLKLIMIAIVIGTPIAWWAMHNWLQSFAYRIEITWWVFGLAAAVALGIACLTVSIQAIRAAISNPVKSIRNN